MGDSGKEVFTRLLMRWHRQDNGRQMPWKGIRDPYRIWLAETILQQTRVEQGWAYYERFVQAYPTLEQLAYADEQAVYRLWQGLGYYNRCRNLLHTARELVQHYGGEFPRSYDGLLSLKGIGPYTAAAIASFAFGLPHAVVDGNVLRVLARYFALHIPVDLPEGKKLFSQLAHKLLDVQDPGAFNQAVMDLGATICKPRRPACNHCPLAVKCQAFHLQQQMQFPVKAQSKSIQSRYFHYLVIRFQAKTLLQRRIQKDIWRGLFEFPLIEKNALWEVEHLQQTPEWQNQLPTDDWSLKGVIDLQQQLTHRRIHARFFYIETPVAPHISPHQLLVGWDDLCQYALPGIIVKYLRRNPYSIL
ncbi:MAG: A/G-specific adenine glycosylase [Thermoflavifilum sp.]|nr:A/G-specific adenine glycosylase [Thermoflavifilum sp.]